MTDAEILDWLEAEARKSPTGISFDYVPSVDGEPSGWRFMRRHFIGEAKKSLRSAIIAAREQMAFEALREAQS
jgi:hypothetical protein